MTATDLRMILNPDEQVRGGAVAGVNPIGGYLDLELTNDVANVQITGTLRHHGPELVRLLDDMSMSLHLALARDCLNCREQAWEERFQRDCAKLVSECELAVDMRIEARVG